MWRALLLVAVLTVVAGCATTSLGPAIQLAETQKGLVEQATIEVIRNYTAGNVPDQEYAKIRAEYGKWFTAQNNMIHSLIMYQQVQTKANEYTLMNDLSELKGVTEAYLTLISKYVDLNVIRRELLKGGPPSTPSRSSV